MKKLTSCVIRITLLCIALLLCAQLLPTASEAADLSRLEQAIIDSYSTGKGVNVTPYDITKPELREIFWDLQSSGRLPWYAKRNYYIDYDVDTLQVYNFYPATLSTSTYNRSLYEKRIQEILDASIHDGMTPLQKALSIHDYLIAHCTYDSSKNRNTGYDLVVHGSTMCTGYAEAYMDILNRLGIPCKLVQSDAMNHAWNLVQLEGQWYHVDLTWDDPTPNSYGMARHLFFLLTDEEMLTHTLKHYGWETDVTCTDTRYVNAFWKNAESAIVYLDHNTCFVRRYQRGKDYIYIRDEASGAETPIFSDSNTSINIGYGNRSYAYQGLSLWNSRLYFASLDTVYSCELDGSDLQTVYSYDAAANQKYIYGILAERNTVFVTFRDHDRNTSTLEIPLNNADQHIHHYTAERISATCMTGGSSQYHCDCGFSFAAISIPPLGHQYEQIPLSSDTSADENTVQFTCTRCGSSYHTNANMLAGINWAKGVWAWLSENNAIGHLLLIGTLCLIGWLLGKRKNTATE